LSERDEASRLRSRPEPGGILLHAPRPRRAVSPYIVDLDSLPRDDAHRVEWSRVFEREAPLRIEVGIGNSAFLIEVARLEPGYNYLGVEYSWKRVIKYAKRVESSGETRIRILPVHADRVLEGAVRPGELDHLFLNFPDPWPKRRHAKKRFVQDDSMTQLRTLLAIGGGLSFKTDMPEYAFQMLAVLDRSPGLTNLAGTGRFSLDPRYPFPTPFELAWRAEGRRVFHLEYVRAY
jgi:tRNA (guanine-N7-)-methyltransferase